MLLVHYVLVNITISDNYQKIFIIEVNYSQQATHTCSSYPPYCSLVCTIEVVRPAFQCKAETEARFGLTWPLQLAVLSDSHPSSFPEVNGASSYGHAHSDVLIDIV